MSSTQLIEWLEYYRIEPFGYAIENYRFGSIPASIYNSVRGDKHDHIWQANEFYPVVSTENIITKKQDWNDQLRIANSICNAFIRKEG